MRRIRSKDTSPELTVRRIVHALGFRYRLHGKRLPGCPDLVFSSRKKAIFVHGCFWHQHKNCIDGRVPKSRTEYWQAKLSANKERDVQNRKKLKAMGWSSLIIWECQMADEDRVAGKVEQFLQH